VITSKAVAALAVITLTLATFSGVDTSRAGGGDVAAGLIGGFAAGAIVGSQLARPRYPGPVYYEYAAPGPVYYEYYAPPPAYYPAPCWSWRGEYRYRVC